MELPFTVELRQSRRLAILLVVAHGTAVAMAMLVPIHFWIKLALLMLVLASAWGNLRRQHGPKSIVSLSLRGDGQLEFSRRDGTRGEARVHPHTTVTAQLVVLLLRQAGRSEVLVLMPDALASEDFRLLRLWLRWRTAADK